MMQAEKHSYSLPAAQLALMACATRLLTLSRYLAGGLENLFHHSGNTPPRRSASPERGGADSFHADSAPAAAQPEANTVECDYLEHVCSVLQHL